MSLLFYEKMQFITAYLYAIDILKVTYFSNKKGKDLLFFIKGFLPQKRFFLLSI